MTTATALDDAAGERPARPVCDRCRRPEVACYCAHVHLLPTRTRLLLLQHPRERRVGVGTARMAHLSLPSSVLRVGTDFAADPVVRGALAGPTPVYVLFPGPTARDVSDLPRDADLTIVVLDGTWSLARKLLNLNPALAALPRVAFRPRRPSEYRIRRQPAGLCVSTIEALAQVLDVLEPAAGPFERLLDPFRAMVARQKWYESEVRTRRHHLGPRTSRTPRRPPLPERLALDWPRLVCIQGEANAWPRRDPQRSDPETVHWVAHRPLDGATYEAVIAPRRTLAPATPAHLDLPAARLLAGGTVEAWHRSWQELLRPDDVIVQWGTYYGNLASAEGLRLGDRCMDLRAEVSQMLGRRVGTVEDCARQVAAVAPALGLSGRGGRRLGALVGVLRALVKR